MRVASAGAASTAPRGVSGASTRPRASGGGSGSRAPRAAPMVRACSRASSRMARRVARGSTQSAAPWRRGFIHLAQHWLAGARSRLEAKVRRAVSGAAATEIRGSYWPSLNFSSRLDAISPRRTRTHRRPRASVMTRWTLFAALVALAAPCAGYATRSAFALPRTGMCHICPSYPPPRALALADGARAWRARVPGGVRARTRANLCRVQPAPRGRGRGCGRGGRFR